MKKQWMMVLMMVLVLGVVDVQAQYDLREMTPIVKSALDARRGRFDELKSLKAQGIIGENNQGYLEVLIADSRAEELVRLENRDRLVIYKTIIEQNDLTGALATVEKVFANVQANKAEPGEMVQNENGRWAAKQ